MSVIPPDFGGFLGYWSEKKAYLVRYGQGRPQESVRMTPLNLLQARKTLDALIEQGRDEGYITDEHLRQSTQMPTSHAIDRIMPRDRVDEIAGED